MSEQNTTLARTNGKFKRVRPFHGMLLGAEDFLDEQSYLRKKIKLQNQLRGYGVVCGLQLEHLDDPAKNPKKSKIIVKSGMALDCNGNEIVVCEEQEIDLADAIDDLFHVTQTRTLYIGIKYSERNAEPEAVYTADCGCEEKRCDFSRVQEGYLIKAFKTSPPPCHPFCLQHQEREHYVLLGWLDFSDKLVTQEKIKNYRKYTLTQPFIPEAEFIRICEEDKWVNIAFVIGMEHEKAINELKSRKFGNVASAMKKLNKSNLLLLWKGDIDSFPFADPNKDTISLYGYVNDESKSIVLFPEVTRG